MARPRRSRPVEDEEIEPQSCTIDRRLEILRRVPFFEGLSPDEVAEINTRFREEGYAAGQQIYSAGEPATHLYVVAAGKVKVVRHTLDGQDLLLDILAPGEFFGSLSALGDEEYPETAEARTSCCVLRIGAGDFQSLLRRYPAVSLKVLEIVVERLRAAHETIRQLSAHPVEQRVAASLLNLAEKLGEAWEGSLLIQVPLSREDLAAMTGTTTESVSRALSQFRRDGLIRSGRQWIAIVDPHRLAVLARGEEAAAENDATNPARPAVS